MLPPPPWVVDESVGALDKWMQDVGLPLHRLSVHLKMHREARLRVPIPINKPLMADAFKTHFCLCAQPADNAPDNSEKTPKWYFASTDASLQAACWVLTELDPHDTLLCPGSHRWVRTEESLRRRQADFTYTPMCCRSRVGFSKSQRRGSTPPKECFKGDACTKCHVFAERCAHSDRLAKEFCLLFLKDGYCDRPVCFHGHTEEECPAQTSTDPRVAEAILLRHSARMATHRGEISRTECMKYVSWVDSRAASKSPGNSCDTSLDI